jgi:branched-chain amino acid transport system permease protein
VLGGIYALFAVGLTLIFGVLDVINVAHGEFFTLGGYAAFVAVVLWKLPPTLSLPIAALAAFLIGLAVYPVLIQPLQKRLGRRAPGPLFLVLTLGLSAFMQNSMLAVAGGEYMKVPPLMRGGVDFSFTYVSNQRLLVFAVACAALVVLFLFLRYHRQGAAIRAVTQNPASAQAVGIPLARIFTLTIGLGCGLAGLGGALIAPLFNVYPAVGFSLTLKAFAITILGGMGNVLGALVASFIIAVTEAMSVIVIPSEWTNAIAFGLMILVLLVRPDGILGRRRG